MKFKKTRRAIKEYLHGGLADGLTDSDFSQAQIEKGAKVEKEHTDNPQIAEEIARDHLVEKPDYYDELSKSGL